MRPIREPENELTTAIVGRVHITARALLLVAAAPAGRNEMLNPPQTTVWNIGLGAKPEVVNRLLTALAIAPWDDVESSRLSTDGKPFFVREAMFCCKSLTRS
mgnify:CR=1 FL=1